MGGAGPGWERTSSPRHPSLPLPGAHCLPGERGLAPLHSVSLHVQLPRLSKQRLRFRVFTGVSEVQRGICCPKSHSRRHGRNSDPGPSDQHPLLVILYRALLRPLRGGAGTKRLGIHFPRIPDSGPAPMDRNPDERVPSKRDSAGRTRPVRPTPNPSLR